MKKLFSLLTLALLTMSAVASTVVEMDFSAQGYSNGAAVDECTVNNVTATFNKGTNTSNAPKYYTTGSAIRLYGGNTMTVTAPTNILSIEFTFASGEGTNNILSTPGNYVTSNKTWTIGSDPASQSVVFTIDGTSGHRRVQKLVITIEDAEPVTELVAPVFNPNGGEFEAASLAVTVSCATKNASIYLFQVLTDEDGQEYDQYVDQFFPDNNGDVSGEFYVTESGKYGAYSFKGNEMSDNVYATFTKVLPTCATPTFTPASGATFTDSETVRIDCATEGATIMYQVNNGDVEMDEAPVYIEITETSTITAFASCDGYNDSQEVTATFTKLSAYNVGNVVEFVALTDTVEGGMTAGWHTIVKDGVTMKFYGTVSNYTADNGTEYHQYRIYKNNTIQFTTAAGNIRKIEFDCDETNPVTGFNAIDGLDMTTATWEGNTRDITFTAGSKQVRANTITVTLDDQVPAIVVAAPTFDPAACEFDESIDVTINCATEGATLHYVVGNGDEQTATAPVTVTLTETTTITAYAELDGVESEIVEATYTLKEATGDITTLAQARALEDNTEFTFGGNVVVVYKNGSNLWVKDETASGLIYGSGLTNFEQGTVLNSGWSAKKVMYQTIIPEFSNPANVTASEQEKVTVEPTVVEISAIDASMMNDYIRINNVMIDSISSSDNKNYYANGMVLRNQFGGITLEAGKTYSLIGLATAYKGVPQVYITEVVDAPQPEVYDVNNIAEALALDPNSQFTMYNDVVVTYHNGKRLFIRDTDGNSGMIYDTNNAIEGTFANGQVLSDGWTAKYEVYNGLPEFTNPVDVAADGNNTRVADPYEYTTITDANVNEYVIMKGLTILPDAENSKNFYNAADSLLLYDQFGVQPTIEEGKTYDVIGAVTIYKNKVQLYIISVTEAAAGLRGDVNDDKAVNISDVTSLIDYLLNPATVINETNANVNLDEAINISDVTVLIDFLLSGTWPNK